jgi:hypothetical protein
MYAGRTNRLWPLCRLHQAGAFFVTRAFNRTVVAEHMGIFCARAAVRPAPRKAGKLAELPKLHSVGAGKKALFWAIRPPGAP